MKKMKTMFLNFFLGVSALMSGAIFAQQVVPTIDTSYNFGSLFINPAFYQSTSFGGLDCQYYNNFSSGVYNGFGLTPPFGCNALSDNYNLPNTESIFVGQLGENETLSEADLLKYTNRKDIRENLYDPYGEVSRFVNRTLSGPTRSFCPSDYSDEDSVPSVDLELTLSSEERERLFSDLGDQPAWSPVARGRGRLEELPSGRLLSLQ
jgi:hypothetical protein